MRGRVDGGRVTRALAVPRHTVSVAPMVDITHRHFRYMMRLISRRAVLWTPMLVARKLDPRQLRYHPNEKPPVAQLGGDEEKSIIAAALRCQELGYSEVNLNLGCPARSAQAGKHGILLMLPESHDSLLSLVKTMSANLDIPVSCKVRIGVDDHDTYPFFRDFVGRLHAEGGITRFVVHARKGLLKGLPQELEHGPLRGIAMNQQRQAIPVTTRQNRLDEIVPLRYEYVHRLKREMPHLRIEINGGIGSIAQMQAQLKAGVDGVMLGRMARDDPFFFAQVDTTIFGDDDRFKGLSPLEARLRVLEAYADYCRDEQAAGHEHSREMLLKPTNQLLAGLPEKDTYGRLIRSTPKAERPRLFGDELKMAIAQLRSTRARKKAPSRAQQVGRSPRKESQLPARKRGSDMKWDPRRTVY